MDERGRRPAEQLGFEAGAEVEIITTITAPPPMPSLSARAELVSWCLRHRLPVPGPRRQPERAGPGWR